MKMELLILFDQITKPVSISSSSVAVVVAAIADVLASACPISSIIAAVFASICPVCPPVNVCNSIIAEPCKSLLILISVHCQSMSDTFITLFRNLILSLLGV
jgi:hypothetical protein